VTELTVTGDATRAEWDAFVDAHPDASGYHAWAWREVLGSGFGHDTSYLAARRDGRLVGVLPLVIFRSWLFGRFVVSLPFVNHGGVLAVDAPAARALLDSAMSEVRRVGAAHLELRHVRQQFPDLPSRTHKVAMHLPLAATRDAAWASLDRKVRNQVRKAEGSGLAVEAGGAEMLDGFYRVFAHNMRDLGTPVYSRRFFEAVLTRLADRATCIVVRREGEAVAGAITLRWRDTIEVPWASSLRQYRTLSANTLLYWAMIERAIAAGATVFDFGRSSPDSGPYHFKRQWGAIEQPLCWEYGLADGRTLPNLGTTNPRFALMIATWKRMPVRLATALGPRIVRSIP
jgi:FemAB-related protein (PEP-CTERM system-associated)